MNSSTGAPLAFKDKVMIGNGGADYGARGFVTAYDQKTGKRDWRFYTVPGSPEENAGDPAMERAAQTWSGEYWKTGTGGTAWNGMTFDPELNRVYIGTGNGGPYDPAVRSPAVNGIGGDNLYLASIVALDADTGKYVWHYQVNPREAWDYKATANMILATIPVDGRPRRVLMQAPTNGFFYVLDRETGKLLSAEKVGKVTWARAHRSQDRAPGREAEYSLRDGRHRNVAEPARHAQLAADGVQPQDRPGLYPRHAARNALEPHGAAWRRKVQGRRLVTDHRRRERCYRHAARVEPVDAEGGVARAAAT